MLRNGFQYYFLLINGILGNVRSLANCLTLAPLFYVEVLGRAEWQVLMERRFRVRLTPES